MMDLSGKTVVVTGASRGIGAATARALNAAGARTIIHASRHGIEFDAVAGEVCMSKDDALIEDFSDRDAGFRLFDRALQNAPRIDAVINNAGVFLDASLMAPREEWTDVWARTQQINVQAPADICFAAIAHYRKSGGGVLVNIASRAGHRGDSIDGAAYAASKGAILAMTKTFARQLGGKNILAYAIAPGWVETRMAPKEVAARAAATAEIPLGRVAAPEEIAAMAVFLAGRACPSATGATFDINGASYVR